VASRGWGRAPLWRRRNSRQEGGESPLPPPRVHLSDRPRSGRLIRRIGSGRSIHPLARCDLEGLWPGWPRPWSAGSERDVAGRGALLQLDDDQLLHDSPPLCGLRFSVSVRIGLDSVGLVRTVSAQNGMYRGAVRFSSLMTTSFFMTHLRFRCFACPGNTLKHRECQFRFPWIRFAVSCSS